MLTPHPLTHTQHLSNTVVCCLSLWVGTGCVKIRHIIIIYNPVNKKGVWRSSLFHYFWQWAEIRREHIRHINQTSAPADSCYHLTLQP